MNSEKFINETLPQDKAQQFADILKNAVSSYIDNRDNCNVKEWLRSYLSEQIPDKNAEEIAIIRDSIISTVEIYERTVESMQNALNSGKSVEAWFQEETNNGIPSASRRMDLSKLIQLLRQFQISILNPMNNRRLLMLR